MIHTEQETDRYTCKKKIQMKRTSDKMKGGYHGYHKNNKSQNQQKWCDNWNHSLGMKVYRIDIQKIVKV